MQHTPLYLNNRCRRKDKHKAVICQLKLMNGQQDVIDLNSPSGSKTNRNKLSVHTKFRKLIIILLYNINLLYLLFRPPLMKTIEFLRKS